MAQHAAVFTSVYFTGSIGGTYAVPVVVVPQVMIGALGRLQTVPRFVNSGGKPAGVADIERYLWFVLMIRYHPHLLSYSVVLRRFPPPQS